MGRMPKLQYFIMALVLVFVLFMAFNSQVYLNRWQSIFSGGQQLAPTVNDTRPDRGLVSSVSTDQNLLVGRKQSIEILNYFRWKNEGACQLYYEFGGRVLKWRQFAGVDGQKAVCLDPGLAPRAGTCVVYSFGINRDWTFDEAMEKYGCDVYAFDPSMGLKNHQHSAHIHFFNLGLWAENPGRNGKGWKMSPMAQIRKYLRHSHRTIDYLKMDIEGEEWNVLRQLVDTNGLVDVKQLAVEIHVFDWHKLNKHQLLLRDLERSGFVRFFSRENIWTRNNLRKSLHVNDSSAFEIAWFNSNFSDKSFQPAKLAMNQPSPVDLATLPSQPIV